MSSVYFSAYCTNRGFTEIETTAFKGVKSDVELENEQDVIGGLLFPVVKKKFKPTKKIEYFYECYLDWSRGKILNVQDDVFVEL